MIWEADDDRTEEADEEEEAVTDAVLVNWFNGIFGAGLHSKNIDSNSVERSKGVKNKGSIN